jgi:hypothetical protein
VEEAHFLARGAVAFVDADGFSFRLGASGEFQTNLILHETAVARAFVCFEVRRHGVCAGLGKGAVQALLGGVMMVTGLRRTEGSQKIRQQLRLIYNMLLVVLALDR